MVELALDDTIGPQMPWESDRCPARGPALTHYLTRKPVGTCLHCGVLVILRISFERIFRYESYPFAASEYRALGRLHRRQAMDDNAAQRPIRSRLHSHAADLLAMASVSEDLDIEPEGIGGEDD